MKRKRVVQENISKAADKKLPLVDRNQEECFLNYVNYVTEEISDSDESDNSSKNSYSESDSDTYSPSSSSMESDGSFDDENTNRLCENSKANKKAKYLINRHGKFKLKELGYLSRKQRKSKTRYQEPRYCKKELKVALEVIKKVMKMEEAKPFNIPMDPVALGMADCLDVMDFSTISRDLQSGVKYRNAADVLKDVQLFWENSYKYNKKNECSLILMKCVKKKFMKYWTAAGLYTEQKWKIEDNSHILPPTGSLLTATTAAYQPQQHQPSITQPESHEFSTFPGHRYKTRNPMVPETDSSTLFQAPKPQLNHNLPYYSQLPQQSTSQVQHSQSQTGIDIGTAGFSQLPPNTELAMKHSKYVPQSVVNSIICSPDKFQPQTIYNNPYSLQQSENSSQLLPSRLEAGADIDGDDHMRRHNESVPSSSESPIVKPGQLQPQKPMLRDSQSNDLQGHKLIFYQLQSSQPQNCVHTDSADFPVRDSSSKQRHLTDSMIDTPNNKLQLQQSPSQPMQYESQQLLEKKRKGRGPAKCQFLKDMRDGERMKVPVNSQGEPFGPESTKLSSFVGTIARNGLIVPLTIFNWKEMPEAAKEQMWECVKSKFDIDPSCRTWILNSIANKWTNWRAELKEKHYCPHQNDEDRLKDCDPRVLPDQWPVLVSYWSSEKAKIQSAKNKANRAKQTSTNCAGRKSYASLREEERAKRPNGEEPTEAVLYILTHTRKNGQPLNAEAEAKILQLQDQAKRKKSLEGNDDNVRTATSKVKGSSTNKELSTMLAKIEGLEQKFAYMETLVTRMTSILERLFHERNVWTAPIETSGTKQVPSDALENSPQSRSSSHEIRSQEALFTGDLR